jgi:hypothetical protein
MSRRFRKKLEKINIYYIPENTQTYKMYYVISFIYNTAQFVSRQVHRLLQS